MRYRVIGVAIAFALGIAVDLLAAGEMPLWVWWSGAVVGFAMAIGAVRWMPRSGVRAVVIVLPLVAIGGLRAAMTPSFSDALLRQVGSFTESVGTVVSYPSVGSDRITFTLRPDAVVADLLVTWVVDPHAVQPVLYGDRLRVEGWSSLPEAFDGFDYPAYLERQGIAAQMRVAGEAAVTRLGVQDGTGLLRRGNTVRQWILDALSVRLPAGQAALAGALLLGDRAALSEEVERAFRAAGLMHVLAVSGLHLGIVLAGLWFALRRLHIRAAVAYPIVGCVVLLVLWIVGPRVSLLRAGLLFAFLALGNVLADLGLILKASIRPLNGLAAAALVLLGWRPGALLESGFQLTVAATAAILVVVSNAYGSQRRIESICVHAGVGRTPLRYVLTLAAVSLAAQVGTAPITAWHFGAVHPWAVVANVAVVPLAALALWTGLVSVIVGGLGAWGPLRLFEWMLCGLEGLMRSVAGWPGAELAASRGVGAWLGGVVLLGALVWRYGSRSSCTR